MEPVALGAGAAAVKRGIEEIRAAVHRRPDPQLGVGDGIETGERRIEPAEFFEVRFDLHRTRGTVRPTARPTMRKRYHIRLNGAH
jgi:hypothetical protein